MIIFYHQFDVSLHFVQDIRQDVVVDLVEQCHNYKQRAVHLVNSTSYDFFFFLVLYHRFFLNIFLSYCHSVVGMQWNLEVGVFRYCIG